VKGEGAAKVVQAYRALPSREAVADMEYSYKERETINAALQAGRKVASKAERTLTDVEFQELEPLAANCPIPVPLKDVRRAAKLRDELAGLLQTCLLARRP
jgi:hypothetical protein